MNNTKVIYLILLCMLGWIPTAVAQSVASSQELRQKITNTIVDYKNKGFEVMRVEVGEIEDKKTVAILRELNHSKTYEIRAFSIEEEIKDLDLRVYQKKEDGKWNLEILDRSDLPGARVRFVPAANSLYQIAIKGYSFRTTAKKGKYALVIAIMN